MLIDGLYREQYSSYQFNIMTLLMEKNAACLSTQIRRSNDIN